MIVSALLTSVGINLALSLFFFALYSILRKQPHNENVYFSRFVAQSRSQSQSQNSHHAERSIIGRLLPSPRWLLGALRPSEDDLLSTVGLDALVFMRIFVFSLRVFIAAGIIGVFVLLPVNYRGDQLTDFDFFDIPNESLDKFSISNVKDGSKWLWVHFIAGYAITGIVCFLLYLEYEYISSKRLEYFYASKPQPQEFTILVRGIPRSTSHSFSESIDQFFTEHYPSLYLSHLVVCRTSKLRGLIEVPAAFVSFRSRYGAATAIHIPQSINPTQWITEQAPEPRDVYWPSFSDSFLKRWIFQLVAFAASIFLTVVFFIPVVFVQGLTNLEQLDTLFPFLQNILSIKVVSQVVTGYLPSLILLLFLYIVPPIMIRFSKMQGYISYSDIERSACIKMLSFTVWNIFFANVLSGSVASQIDVFLNPKNIPSRLAVAVPAQASFFIAYVVTSGWTSISSELTRTLDLLSDFMRRHFLKWMEYEFQAPAVPFHSEIPRILFFGLLGIIYFLLAPIILPFLLVYYCLGYIVYRNQLLNVYVSKYESGGKLWPIVHNTIIFSLILMQAIAIGIFGLKGLPLASSFTIPLPVLTLIFNDYCCKRFLPIFNAYPAECLIKKDHSDQSDPSMMDFFSKLGTAYRDPALLHVHYSTSTVSCTSPLLSDQTQV